MEKKKKKKKWIIIAVVVLVVLIGGFGGGSDDENSFTITAGKTGEYGKLITYHEGTEFEETLYAYYVPAGTYTVTNIGEYGSQITVCSDETVITDTGWEESVDIGDVELMGVGDSYTLTVEEGYHIEIIEPAVFELVKQ